MSRDNNWKILKSEVAHQNNWYKVVKYDVVQPDGKPGQYNVVEKNDFVVIIPYDGQKFHLVGQYRFPTKMWSWEFVKGGINTDEPPEDAAHRELKEETGISTQKLTNYGYFHEANGHSSQGFTIFLAEDLSFGKSELEGTELGMEVKKFTLEEIEEMIKNAQIKDSPSIVAYTQFILHQN